MLKMYPSAQVLLVGDEFLAEREDGLEVPPGVDLEFSKGFVCATPSGVERGPEDSLPD